MTTKDKDKGDKTRLSRVNKRLAKSGVSVLMDDPSDVLYQHSVLCQTYLPPRDPGTSNRWERRNGDICLIVNAGEILNPDLGATCAGLPFGPKARIVLAELNSRALKGGARVVELEEASFTEFVRLLCGRSRAGIPNGPTIRAYKDQLLRLSVARFTLGYRYADGRVAQKSPQILSEIDVGWARDGKQRSLWPDTLILSEEYWNSLQKHAVPLDSRALSALSHSSMALDIYQWLSQRLHRIKKTVTLGRGVLREQFGVGYTRERDFWIRGFLPALRQVQLVYPDAKVEVTPEGLELQNSPPPVRLRGRLLR